MHERFIALSTGKGFGGYWGSGETLEKAKKNLKASGGHVGKKPGLRVFRFTSELPFAPAACLQATDQEADCWVGQDGSMNWVRCQREEVKL